jgi:hemerythrin
VPEIDEQHRMLFDMIDGLAAVADGRTLGDPAAETVDKIIALARSHLLFEETLAARAPAAGYDAAVRDHGEFLRKVEGLSRYLETAPVDALHTMADLLKDWVIDHTLLENRRFKEALAT